MNFGLDLDRIFEVHALVVGDDLAALTDRDTASAALTAMLEEMDAHIGGMPLYPSLLERAAVLAGGTVRRVPFQVGNWPTAAALVDVFLTTNGVTVDLGSASEVGQWLFDLSEKDLDVAAAVEWLSTRVTPD